VDILARQHGVLLMPGSPFGAPQYMRLSYGGLPPEDAVAAVQRLADGFQHLTTLSVSR
jgi:aspartate/methionine/tyrosine aminotransferase